MTVLDDSDRSSAGEVAAAAVQAAPDELKSEAAAAAVQAAPDELKSEVAAAASGEGSVRERTAIGTRVGASNDTVKGVADQLGFRDYVAAFASLIKSGHTKPPLTIGIYGSWGMGKSFLLERIKEAVEANKGDGTRECPRVHVVPFNAWEYSASPNVWPGLVRGIVKKLDEDVPWPWYKRYWTRLGWNLSRALRRCWPALLTVTLVAVLAIIVAVLNGLAALLAVVAALVGSVGLAGLVKAASSNPVAGWVTALFADSDYGRHIGIMDEIRHDLEVLERRLYEKANRDKPAVGRILVLIDDLDRCEPEKAVEVLQAVNLLLNFPSFIVCLGIDTRIVTGMVEKHYQGLLGEAGASGYEYLEKVIQIPFRIPVPTADEVRAFIVKQLDLGDPASSGLGQSGGQLFSPGDQVPPGSEGKADVAFTEKEIQAFRRLAPYLRRNPRHLKRLVNVYMLVRELARAKHEEGTILCNPTAAIRWLVMWSQWPYTAWAMMDRFDEIREQGHDSVADPLAELLAEVAPKLKPEVRDRLDDEADRLTDLVNLDGCRLSWAEIDRIRRYTVHFNPAVEEYLREIRPPGAA